MYFIGYDLGSSSVKVALVEAESGKCVKVVNEPENEMAISAVQNDWAEQDPEMWWDYACKVTKRVISESNVNPNEIKGIGISYQMHGLVVVDKNGNPLRDSIIWCDSRAVEIGAKAFEEIGTEKCMSHLLNSPGNFTASKLKWVKENEPEIFNKIHKFMLPGDYLAYKLTDTIRTTDNGLSEGILWDFKNDTPAQFLMDYYGISSNLLPKLVENFTNQGSVSKEAASVTGLPEGIPIVYRAGDQPNNALALNILNSGEVAATGGTSGVVYAVTNSKDSKEPSRINHFAHVNHTIRDTRIGKLLCINGAGILYRWLRNMLGNLSYEEMNGLASKVPVGSDGVVVLPFGNGAERMLNSVNTGVQLLNVNLNMHSRGHLCRAALEGIAFAFVYGMDILKNDNAHIDVIRAGNDNLFRSEIFSDTVATLIGHEIEIYNTTGAVGAARAVGLQNGDYKKFGNQIMENNRELIFKPKKEKENYVLAYEKWKKQLEIALQSNKK